MPRSHNTMKSKGHSDHDAHESESDDDEFVSQYNDNGPGRNVLHSL